MMSTPKNIINSSQLYGVQIQTDEAKILSSYVSILLDLEFVIKVLKRLVSALKEETIDGVLVESLWKASLVSYMRCFSHGKRFRIEAEVIYVENQSAIDFHNWIKNLRNKHIAHSVNPYEEVVIDLQLTPPEGQLKEIIAVTHLASKHISPDIAGVENFLKLSTWSRYYVNTQCKLWTDKVFQAVKTMPIDELYKNARSRILISGPKAAGGVRNS